MATGTLTIHVPSIDYTGRAASGTCYTDANKSAFNRGTMYADSTFNWTVDGSGLFTISLVGTTGTTAWYVESVNGYWLRCEYSTDGVNWATIGTEASVGAGTYHVVDLTETLASQLTPFIIRQTGYIRLFTYTIRACPTSDRPNAYPNDEGAASEADPIYIVLDYTPMAVKHGDSWNSCNRTNGRLRARKDGAWGDTNLKTIDGGTGTTDPPSLRRNSTWYNQNKRGAE